MSLKSGEEREIPGGKIWSRQFHTKFPSLDRKPIRLRTVEFLKKNWNLKTKFVFILIEILNFTLYLDIINKCKVSDLCACSPSRKR